MLVRAHRDESPARRRGCRAVSAAPAAVGPRDEPAHDAREVTRTGAQGGGVSGRRRAGRTRRADRAGRVARERGGGSAHRETPGRSVDGAVRDRGAAAVSGAIFRVRAVANPAAQPPFREWHFTLMQSLAEQAALALYQAELLHLQLELRPLELDLALASGSPQMLLLRAGFTPARLDVAARYAPAQKVGGDFYGVFARSGTQPGWWSRMSPEKGFRCRGCGRCAAAIFARSRRGMGRRSRCCGSSTARGWPTSRGARFDPAR